jgi:hypothetical protein
MYKCVQFTVLSVFILTASVLQASSESLSLADVVTHLEAIVDAKHKEIMENVNAAYELVKKQKSQKNSQSRIVVLSPGRSADCNTAIALWTQLLGGLPAFPDIFCLSKICSFTNIGTTGLSVVIDINSIQTRIQRRTMLSAYKIEWITPEEKALAMQDERADQSFIKEFKSSEIFLSSLLKNICCIVDNCMPEIDFMEIVINSMPFSNAELSIYSKKIRKLDINCCFEHDPTGKLILPALRELKINSFKKDALSDSIRINCFPNLKKVEWYCHLTGY